MSESVLLPVLEPLKDDLMNLAGVGLGIGAVVFGVKIGWLLLRKLARDYAATFDDGGRNAPK